MAAPTRNLYNAPAGSTGTTSYTPSMTTLASGSQVKDLIVLAIATDGNTTVELDNTSSENGWLWAVLPTGDGSGACKAGVAYFEVTSAGTVTNPTFTSSGSEAFSCQGFRIRGDGTNPVGVIAGTPTGASSTNPNPPSATSPAGDTVDIYSLCGFGGDGVTTSSAAPTNWGNHQTTTISNASNGCTVGSADRTLNAQASATAIDPGTFTRATEQWAAWHLLFYNNVQPALTQRAFRFYEEGTESGATAIAAENTNINRSASQPFHIRLGFQHTAGLSVNSRTLVLQRRVNGGGWSPVTGASTFAQTAASAGLTDSADTTQRLSSGSGSFVAGEIDDNNGQITDSQAASSFTEHLFSVVLLSTNTDGDVIEFRVVDNSFPAAVFTYTEIPAVTFQGPGSLSQDHFRFYNADGDEATATAIAAEDANITVPADTDIHLRLLLQETAGKIPNSPAGGVIQYSLNGGAYSNLSGNVTASPSGLTEAAVTTQRLAGGSGTFAAGRQEEDNGQVTGAINIPASGNTELVFSINLGAGLSDGDTVDFRFKYALTSLEAYGITPRATIGSGVPLVTAQDSTHAHSSDQATIAQKSTITPADATHGHSSDQASLSFKTTVTAQDSTHGHSSDQATIAQKSVLVAQDSTHSHTSNQSTVTYTPLTIVGQDSTHVHTSDQASLAFKAAITVQDSTHAHSSDQATIATKSVLVPDDSTHTHLADQATIAFKAVIASQDSTHGHSSDQADIIDINIVGQDSTHALTSDQASIATQNVVVPDDSTHVTSSDQATLAFKAPVTAQDATHTHLADQATLTTANILVPQDSTHSVSSDQATIAVQFAIIGEDSTHGVTSDEASVLVSGAVNVHDSTHNLTSDQANLVFNPFILVDDSAHVTFSDEATITTKSAITSEDSTHLLTSDQATIAAKSAITAQDSLHSVDSDQATLSASGQIQAQDATHSLTSDQAAIAAFFAVAPQDSIHVHLADQATVSVSDVIGVDDATHGVSSDQSTIVVFYGITPNDATHGHFSDQVVIAFQVPVTPEDAFHIVTSDQADVTFGVILQPQDATHIHLADQALVGSLVTVIADDSFHGHTADIAVMFIIEGVGENILVAPPAGVLIARANNALSAPERGGLVAPKKENL